MLRIVKHEVNIPSGGNTYMQSGSNIDKYNILSTPNHPRMEQTSKHYYQCSKCWDLQGIFQTYLVYPKEVLLINYLYSDLVQFRPCHIALFVRPKNGPSSITGCMILFAWLWTGPFSMTIYWTIWSHSELPSSESIWTCKEKP